jgi:hypothetical protein
MERPGSNPVNFQAASVIAKPHGIPSLRALLQKQFKKSGQLSRWNPPWSVTGQSAAPDPVVERPEDQSNKDNRLPGQTPAGKES